MLHTPGHTPGSVVAVVERDGQTVLFGQDVHGPFHADFGSDIEAWKSSMDSLLELGADVLCEGHYGVIRPAQAVEAFIRRQLAQQDFL